MGKLTAPLEDEEDACLLDALAEEFDAPQQENVTFAAAARDPQCAQTAKIQQVHVLPAVTPHQPPAHIVEHRRAAMAHQGEMLNLLRVCSMIQNRGSTHLAHAYQPRCTQLPTPLPLSLTWVQSPPAAAQPTSLPSALHTLHCAGLRAEVQRCTPSRFRACHPHGTSTWL